MKTPVVLLTDGTALAYRAYHALPELTTQDGRPTHALLGFIRMLEAFETRWSPEYRLVVFDGGRPEERLQALPEYKAHRPRMPESLIRQLSAIEEYLQLSRRPFLRIPGQEADDLIATLARQAADQGWQVLIAGADKDFYQIVDDHIHLISSSRSDETIGPTEVEKKTGVRPNQIADWLALTGDAVDNVPGVPGVGGKTAARWLQQFGSLDALLAHIHEVEPARHREALQASRDLLMRNARLLKLRTDLPVRADWEAWRTQPPDVDRLLEFYQRMELHSLAREMSKREQGMLDFNDSARSG